MTHNQTLIGVVGRIGSGKSTLSNYLEEKFGFFQLALADPIKRHVSELLGFPYEWTSDSTKKNEMLKTYGLTVREALQLYGTETCQQINKDIWLHYAFRRIANIEPTRPVVISDIRFLHEAERVVEEGGILWYLTRHKTKDTHSSEQIETIYDKYHDTKHLVLIDNIDMELISTFTLVDTLVSQQGISWPIS